MAMLIIAGKAYDVLIGSASQEESEHIGGSSRAFAGNLRSSKRAEKRVWNFTLGPVTQAQHNTLRTDTHLGKQVNCNGEMLDAVNVLSEVVVGNAQFVPNGLSFMRVVAVTIIEV